MSETNQQEPMTNPNPGFDSEQPGQDAPEGKTKKTNKAGKTVGQEILSWVLTIAVAVAAALLIRTFIFEPVKVDGQSMCDTLQNGEVMFTTKYDYLLGSPQVGDIVICNYPNRTSKGLFGITTNTKFVKRLIGLPGDTIKIVDHEVYRMEKGSNKFVKLDQSYLTPERNDDFSTANMDPVTLGEDEYFVMGDNRDSSNDSRYVGPISRKMILAHVRFVFFPLNKIRGVQ